MEGGGGRKEGGRQEGGRKEGREGGREGGGRKKDQGKGSGAGSSQTLNNAAQFLYVSFFSLADSRYLMIGQN